MQSVTMSKVHGVVVACRDTSHARRIKCRIENLNGLAVIDHDTPCVVRVVVEPRDSTGKVMSMDAVVRIVFAVK